MPTGYYRCAGAPASQDWGSLGVGVGALACAAACRESATCRYANYNLATGMCGVFPTCSSTQNTFIEWQVFRKAGAPAVPDSTPSRRPASVGKCCNDACEAGECAQGLYCSGVDGACKALESGEAFGTSCDICADVAVARAAFRWVPFLQPKMRCESPPGEKPTAAADIAVCQKKADDQDRPFMNYEPVRKRCSTSETCNAARETNGLWQAYELSAAPAPDPATPAPSPAPIPPKWAPFSEEKVKCERPRDEAPEAVPGLAECEEKAEKLGRTFLNFDAGRSMCYTSLTCDKQKKTNQRWKIYQLSAPTPTPSPTSKPTPSPTSPALTWTPIKPAEDLAACQREAESKGMTYLNFEPNRLQCFTSSTCNSPKATNFEWQIYHLEQSASRWVELFEPNKKCERPEGEKPVSAADATECQKKAEAEGRKFFNFVLSRKLCYTSITCNSPNSARIAWQAYKLVDEASSSDLPMVESSGYQPMVASAPSFSPVSAPHLKCERPAGEMPVRVANLAECEELAYAKNRDFLTFDPSRRNCYASATCDHPAPSVLAWQIYKAEHFGYDQPWVASSSQSFSPLFEPHRKCERPAGEMPVAVATLAECEAIASSKHRDFVIFDSSRKNCFTSPTCDNPTPSALAWQIYATGEPMIIH